MTPRRIDPWVLGIAVGFLVMLVVNVGFIYIAIKGADPISPSYAAEAR